MTLVQFLDVVRRRWLTITIAVVVGVATAFGVTHFQTPEYRSTAGVFVSVSGSDTIADLSQSNNFSAARVTSYAALATTPEVLRAAATAAGLHGEDAEIADAVDVSTEPDTVIIDIGATATNPDRAAAIANAVAAELIDAVARVERGNGTAVIRLSVVEEAIPAEEPFTPRVPVNIALGLLAGLTLGIAGALLREVLDTRLRSIEVLHRMIDTSVLGEFPIDDTVRDHPLLDGTNRYTPRAEAFRQLRTQLTFTNLEGSSQSLVVTSARPGEGKSTTALNLAMTLAQNGGRVLLVDADLRRPKVGDYLGLESRVGLTTVLARQVALDDAIQTVGDTNPLSVLASGRVPPNPSELLGSQHMADLMRELERRYDYVIVDAPPALPVTDPAILGAICSGVLLVVSMNGHVRRADVQAAHERMQRIGAGVLGVVLNKTPLQRKERSYYHYEASAPLSESPRRVGRARARRSSSTTPMEETS
ncbi:polysaccharide biosynthesis tyrosine autokinase [Curtobacterium sp. MCPF17_002]|uniref:polysaccharide biosynthesis tyrosine autokinase n=1 Tax=Curtobacterium sp. MCPF17_002 TaxID=2175645 RepID=UPI0015E8E2B4|nr:polysaccharide biosynthesis tyrosine autokinase [Curtobacterium sp. MCPF17_002]WIB78035.1 polysaccharide biosynthesis tyrosine autokinase [Curtobacterium sp. MCPF17_002]